MDDSAAELEMARRCYGYGRWDAPYWFIGPEQGKGPKETADNTPRLKAWLKLDETELCDCRKFHCLIGEGKWHREMPALQPAWGPLMLLLMTFLGKPSDNESLRIYQRDRWGRASGGETCLIELSGLAARNAKVPTDRKRFRQETVEIIRQRMLTYKPEFVLMYGASEREHWQQIAGGALHPNSVVEFESTLIAFTPHPVAHGRKNSDWVKLGKKLRLESSSS